MKNKGLIRFLSAVLVCATLVTPLISCSKDNEGDGEHQYSELPEYDGLPEYDIESLGIYIKPFKYTGLTVYYMLGETAQEKLWTVITDGAEIIDYPAAQLAYYADQERAKYIYYAKKEGVGYEELLTSLGVTENDIQETAKKRVKEDLVLAYIVKDAGISLTNAEKSENLLKYARKFAEIYGSDENYIIENMSEQIYDAMLYDKTMEFLLLNNTAYTNQNK